MSEPQEQAAAAGTKAEEHEITSDETSPSESNPTAVVTGEVPPTQLGLESTEEYEQKCLLFPTYATRQHPTDGETDDWYIKVRGWAFSAPKFSRTRDIFLNVTSWAAGLKKDDESYEILQSRTSLFWASNVSKGEYTVQAVGMTDAKKMAIEGDPNDRPAQEIHAEKADESVAQQLIENVQKIHVLDHPKWETKLIKIAPKAGNFSGMIDISKDIVKKWINKEQQKDQGGFFKNFLNFGSDQEPKNKIRLIKIQAYHSESGLPTYGVVNLIEPKGYSVISDIDDTIKDTDISAGAKVVLSNTFLHEFKDVPGMANVYKNWYEKGVGIHYVSNSPWQLFPTLRGFFETYEFPPGSAHLKFYDGLFKSAYEQKENPMASKFMYIREILKDFPQRKLILVGDTGELDPEIYTTIARESPDRILRIFIRDVTTARVRDLPPQQPHLSYVQTFPSILGHLRSYYNEEKAEIKESKAEPTRTSPPEPTPGSAPISSEDPPKFERSGSYTSALLDKFHLDISHLYSGFTPDTNEPAKAPPDAAMAQDADSAASKESKTPLQMFEERIQHLTEGLPEGLFSLFTDSSQLQDDPIITKALNSL